MIADFSCCPPASASAPDRDYALEANTGRRVMLAKWRTALSIYLRPARHRGFAIL